MVWPGFPKRLQSALKALCCLAESGNGMQSQEIAERIRVSKAETAKSCNCSSGADSSRRDADPREAFTLPRRPIRSRWAR